MVKAKTPSGDSTKPSKAQKEKGPVTVVMSEKEMWADKRARQAEDLQRLQDGSLTPDDVNWFAGGVARKAKLIDDLF